MFYDPTNGPGTVCEFENTKEGIYYIVEQSFFFFVKKCVLHDFMEKKNIIKQEGYLMTVPFFEEHSTYCQTQFTHKFVHFML